MRTARFLALTLAISLAICGLAAAAEPVLLKFHQKEGDKAVYAITATVKSKLATAGKAETATESVAMQCGIEFTKAIGMGRMQVTGRLLNGTAKASSGGKTKTQPMPAYEEHYVLTALGDIKSSEIVTGEPVSLPFSDVEFSPLDALAPGALPSKPVKTGDTWVSTEKESIPEADLARMGSTSRLLGEATYAGRRCLKIRTAFRGVLKARLPISGLVNEMPAQATLIGTVVWLFDPDTGIAVKSDVTGTQSMSVRLEGVASVSVTSTIDQHTQLLEWNGEKLTP